MSQEVEVLYMGQATGPTPEMLAAEPWISGGFWLGMAAFLLYFAFAVFLAVKRRAPGAWLTISGLSIVLLYFVFQNTVAADAELRYSAAGMALAYIAYGAGGALAAGGYARLVLHACRMR